MTSAKYDVIVTPTPSLHEREITRDNKRGLKIAAVRLRRRHGRCQVAAVAASTPFGAVSVRGQTAHVLLITGHLGTRTSEKRGTFDDRDVKLNIDRAGYDLISEVRNLTMQCRPGMLLRFRKPYITSRRTYE